MCCDTNGSNVEGTIETAMENADVLICLSTPGPNVIKKEWIKNKLKDGHVFRKLNARGKIFNSIF